MVLLTRAWLIAAVLGSAACNVYDKSLTYSNGGTDGGGSGSGGGDACTAQPEMCNGTDDDCDGTTDEAEAVTNDCAFKVLHSSSTCTTGLCVKFGPCETGYFNCDGLPNNGCEATCCGDGCDEDAGAP